MGRNVAKLVGILLLVAVALLIAAPMALAADDPAGCTTAYAGTAGNPPPEADLVICEDKFCSGGAGVRPSGAGAFTNYEVAAAQAFVACVV